MNAVRSKEVHFQVLLHQKVMHVSTFEIKYGYSTIYFNNNIQLFLKIIDRDRKSIDVSIHD